MCGLAGLIDNSISHSHANELIQRMKNAIYHRGPDDEGTYIHSDNMLVALGHRRLAIIDPEHAKQPMITDDGNVVLIFNGAIYNYHELRRELASTGHHFHTYSDTEVLLHAYLKWNENCLQKLRGMFAFAIYDRRQNILFCARDRVGIKPFYYYFDEDKFIFASEIKALLASGLMKSAVDYEGLQDYITFQFCLKDKTLFKGIYKLEPGYTLTLKISNNKLNLFTKQYWDIHYQIDDKNDESYFVDKLAFLIEDAVRENLHSDVPIGAHLSGGIDSSTVVSLATSMLKGSPFKTFTGAFREGKQFDETFYAKTVAEASCAEYHEIYIPGHEFSDILPKLIYYMDEPAGGPGLFPQYYVSKLASQHVKVVLGGQGGDEIYIGYIRYLVAYLEKCLYGAIFESSHNSQYAVTLETILPNLSQLQSYTPMLQKFWKQGIFEKEDSRYFSLIDRSDGMKELFSPDIFANYSSFHAFQNIFNREEAHSLINNMTYFDLKSSLPALLQVEDRTSMSVSLESRVPLLDHRLIELIASIPPNIKFSNGRPKHLLLKAIKNIIPEKILHRKDKMGFPVPLDQWVKGSAKDFVHDILFSGRAKQRGIYNIKEIEKSYKQNNQFSRVIWGLLCLELWHRAFVDETIAYAKVGI